MCVYVCVCMCMCVCVATMALSSMQTLCLIMTMWYRDQAQLLCPSVGLETQQDYLKCIAST